MRSGKLLAGEKCRYVGAEANDAAIVVVATGARAVLLAPTLFVTWLMARFRAGLVPRFLAGLLPGRLRTGIGARFRPRLRTRRWPLAGGFPDRTFSPRTMLARLTR